MTTNKQPAPDLSFSERTAIPHSEIHDGAPADTTSKALAQRKEEQETRLKRAYTALIKACIRIRQNERPGD